MNTNKTLTTLHSQQQEDNSQSVTPHHCYVTAQARASEQQLTAAYTNRGQQKIRKEEGMT
jgi:hypothetical protein